MSDRVLTLQELRIVNLRRVADFGHGGLQSWNPAEWGNALAGETGELCNVLKKMIRQQEKDLDLSALNDMAMEEAADVAIYLDLLCARLGFSLADAIIAKFNESSRKIGSRVHLCPHPGCMNRANLPPCPLCYE